ncbi:uncharacterized protein LOC132805603 isoform X2 [Hemiscyllium ocellatum]|uniref:uncharacterized protein LOC132805603 isoform X2 n=1 Tax=Hemiscyllium ocellatum TaxID=170820 RepID=UPI002966E444|nr:uncharacterized protein LOC132805603 isoform X2 [Hemiscyllium ocellatum]
MNIITVFALFRLLPVTALHNTLLQTPRLQTVSVGSSIKLNCHTGWYVSGRLHWYKQQLRENLRKVYLMNKNFISDGKKISGEINNTLKIYTLVIDDVQVNDSGRYYCAAWKSYGRPLVFGNGSTLHVTDGMSEINGTFVYQIEPCLLIFYESSLVTIILIIFTVAAVWSYWKRNLRSGVRITDNDCRGSPPHDQKQEHRGPMFDPRLERLSVWSLHVFPVSAWVSSGCSDFHPQSKDVQFRFSMPGCRSL